MIMPFIRLISIYVVVIVAVVAVFKRDQISELTGISMPWTQAEEVELSEEAQQAEEVAAATETTAAQAASAEIAETPDSTPAATEPVEQAEIKMPTADAAPATPEATEVTETTEVAAVTEPAAAATDAAPVDTAARLNEARKTFWNGDVAGAEVLYAALARDEPDNADVHGEFGNVLYAQRRYEEAADAYFATGKLLVENGTPAQVMPLINVLQSLAPQKAASLYAMMTN